MRRLVKVGMVFGLALATPMVVGAQFRDAGTHHSSGLSPEGCKCVRGPVFEKVRRGLSWETGQLDGLKYSQGASLKGQILTTIDMFYRDQPAVFQTYETQSGFPPEIVYMDQQFRLSNRDAWVRIDFSALVSVSPDSESFAGLAYALYVKEDGGDGKITNPGELLCGGDDTCGYLEQTYDAPWLVATEDRAVWASASRSDFFQTKGTRFYEVQVHVFPIHFGTAGSVTLNFGTLMISSGKP